MAAKIVAQFLDRSGEPSTITMKIAAQGGSVTITQIQSFATTLESALEAMSLCTLKNIYFQQDLLTEDPALPSSEWANRENGAVVHFHNDTSGTKGRITVPGPDLDNVARQAQSDEFVLTDTEMAALITWLEANYELAGESITVDKAVYVGRNN